MTAAIEARSLRKVYGDDGFVDRSVRDAGPSAVVVPLAILAAFTLVMTGLAARLFRWDAD